MSKQVKKFTVPTEIEVTKTIKIDVEVLASTEGEAQYEARDKARDYYKRKYPNYRISVDTPYLKRQREIDDYVDGMNLELFGRP